MSVDDANVLLTALRRCQRERAELERGVRQAADLWDEMARLSMPVAGQPGGLRIIGDSEDTALFRGTARRLTMLLRELLLLVGPEEKPRDR